MNTARRLRIAQSLPAVMQGIQTSLREGTLGRHLPRLFAPGQEVAEAHPGLVQSIKLLGVRDGKAAIEIAATSESVNEAVHLRAGASNSYDSLGNLRWRVGGIHLPWLRALIPLEGSLHGTVIQIKQPTTFQPARFGLILNTGSPRRGIPSRHFTSMHAYGGSCSIGIPAVRCWRHNGSMYDDIDVCLPLDSFTTIRLEHTSTALVPVPVDNVLLRTDAVCADRVARRTLRASAMDIAARISAAVAMIDHSAGDVAVADILQDMLGMDKHDSDYAFGFEVESASGRPLVGDDFADKAKAAVMLGAVCAGLRSPFSHENEAQEFVKTLVGFSSHLRNFEDHLITIPTRFSCMLSPDGTQYEALKATIPNTQLV